MKINKILLGAFALSMTFASCSNDEPAKGGSNDNVTDGVKYMAVTISNLSSGGSRATAVGSPEYNDAEGNEGKITSDNLYFLFFDDKGRAFPLAYANVNGVTITNMVKPISISQDETTGGDKELTGTLVLGKSATEPYIGKTPSQVICVANPKTEAMQNLANKPLSEVLAQPTTPASTTWYGENAKFLMTNATYVDENNNLIQAVDVTGCIKNTPDEAKANPVKIYIERVVAKVRASYQNSYTVQRRVSNTQIETTGSFLLDNESVNFTAEINGWQLYNTASQSKAFKDLKTSYPSFNWKWNDYDNHRSYWAESAPGADKGSNTYSLEDATQFSKQSYSYTQDGNTVVTGLTNVMYCFENTQYPDVDVTSRAMNEATGIVLKATIKKDGKAINMYRWAGAYYTEARLKQRVADAYKAAYPSETVSVDKVSFVQNEGKNTYYAKYENTSMAYLFDDILWWKDGVTSYYANIEHLGGNIGVVRNHIYDYTINGIIGLGIPGDNPDMPVEEKTYIACFVRVLDWHVLSNKITLE